MAEPLRREVPGEKLRRLSQAYKAVFDSPQARRVLRDLARRTGAKDSSFVQNSPDATAFNEGRRYVWLRIEAMLRLDEAQLASILTQKEEE